MKKILSIVLGVFLLLGVASLTLFNNKAFAEKPQFRNSQKLSLYSVNSCSSDSVTSTQLDGHVMLITPRGTHDVVVNGVIRNLTPGTIYYVWMRDLNPGFIGNDYIMAYPSNGYYKLVSFETDEYGVGDFHLKFNLEPNTYNVQLAINDEDGYTNKIGCTIAATTKFAEISVE